MEVYRKALNADYSMAITTIMAGIFQGTLRTHAPSFWDIDILTARWRIKKVQEHVHLLMIGSNVLDAFLPDFSKLNNAQSAINISLDFRRS